MGRKPNPQIKVVNLEKDLIKAIRLIHKFLKANNLKIQYTLTLDYKLESYGIFWPNDKHNITINPAQFSDTSREEPHAPYYSTDFSIGAVLIHEFIHLLAEKYSLHESYKERFKDKRLILNENSKKDVHEEIAELGRLYFLNPYFLKLIDESRFNYLKELFESPSRNTKANFISKWRSWNPQIHQLCLEKWGIKVLGNRVFVG